MQKTLCHRTLYCVIFISSFLFGCKKQNLNPESIPTKNIHLLTTLSRYNNEHHTLNPMQMKCSGFWGCLGYVSSVVGADIVGAGTGIIVVKDAAAAIGVATGGTGAVATMIGAGVIVGAGASYTAARTADPEHIPDSLKFGHLNVTLPEKFSYLNDIGVEHNTVLHNNFYNEKPLSDYYAEKEFNEEQISVLNSDYMQQAISDVNSASNKYVLSDYDFKSLTQELQEKKYLTQDVKTVLDLFLEKYTSCVDISEMEDAINFYIKEVSDSELTETEKESLLSSFMVASQSTFYFLTNE